MKVMGERLRKVYKLLDAWQSFIWFYIVGVALHEWGHAMAGWLLGAKTVVIFKPNLSGICMWLASTRDPLKLQLFGLAGGLAVFLMYMWALIFEQDKEDQAALCMYGFAQLCYAIGEMYAAVGALPWELANLNFAIGMLLGIMVWTLLRFTKLLK